LYSLGLRIDSVVWDVGAGTGSIAVEAALIAHQGIVYAIERDEASIGLLQANVDKWGSGNIRIVTGEAPGALRGLADPDSVFIGGSGGNLGDILDVAAQRLTPHGRIVVNLAVLERTQETITKLKSLGFTTELSMVSSSRGREMPDGTTRLESLNPVFVVSAERES
jgi:precorrin-6Y C5,15-methyltransferase (decarboxylating) CbiT subunit